MEPDRLSGYAGEPQNRKRYPRRLEPDAVDCFSHHGVSSGHVPCCKPPQTCVRSCTPRLTSQTGRFLHDLLQLETRRRGMVRVTVYRDLYWVGRCHHGRGPLMLDLVYKTQSCLIFRRRREATIGELYHTDGVTEDSRNMPHLGQSCRANRPSFLFCCPSSSSSLFPPSCCRIPSHRCLTRFPRPPIASQPPVNPLESEQGGGDPDCDRLCKYTKSCARHDAPYALCKLACNRNNHRVWN